MDILKYVVVIVGSYLLGSISTAVLLTKYKYSSDVRDEGSGNAGATNVARVFGLSAGLLTLLGDMLKTVLSALLGHLLMGELGVSLAVAACLIGHCWPVFFKFKGGKGVSVGACMAVILDWRLFLALLVVFVVTFLIWKTVSICSVTSAVLYPVIYYIINQSFNSEFFVCILVMVLVVFMHRDNIKRIIKGEEKKFVPKKKG